MKRSMSVLATISSSPSSSPTHSSIYCELKKSGGEGTQVLLHDGTFYTNFDLAEPSTRNAVLFCLLLSGIISHPVKYAETAASLSLAATSIKTKGYIPKEEMASLCDCFYYDLKADKGAAVGEEIPTKPLDPAVLDMVQQSIRVENMVPPGPALVRAGATGVSDYLSLDFTCVKYDSKATSTSAPDGNAPVSASIIAECKEGAYEIGYEWTADQMKRIRKPEYLDKFIVNDAFKKILKLANFDLNEVIDRINNGKSGEDAIGDNYLNIILVGKPGTGKTTTAEALSAATGMPIYTVKTSKNTEEDTFEGMTKVVEGNFAFRSTPFLEGFEHGGIVVLEEFNLADPGVMQGALGQAIEYPFVLMKDGYQEVKRHPMCIIISTMNTATQGAREPNEALTSRSPVALVMDDPSKEEFMQILASKGYTKKNCAAVYKAYSAIITHLVEVAGSEELVMQVTLRHCLGALKLIKVGVPIAEAINDTMIGSIAIKDLSLALEIKKTVIEPMRF